MLNQEQITALRLLADIYIQQEQPEKGWTLLRLLVACPRAQPDSALLAAFAHACLLTGRHAEALAAIDRSLAAQSPPSAARAMACLIRARALWGLERTEEARAALQDYLQLSQQPQ